VGDWQKQSPGCEGHYGQRAAVWLVCPAYTYGIGLHGAGYDVTGNTPFAYPASFLATMAPFWDRPVSAMMSTLPKNSPPRSRLLSA
jgi:hypothetical protein